MIIFEYGLPYTNFSMYANNYFTVRKMFCVRYKVHKFLCVVILVLMHANYFVCGGMHAIYFV
jgi:hypothetical protein